MPLAVPVPGVPGVPAPSPKPNRVTCRPVPIEDCGRPLGRCQVVAGRQLEQVLRQIGQAELVRLEDGGLDESTAHGETVSGPRSPLRGRRMQLC